MTDQPAIVERDELAYIGLPATTTMAGLSSAIDQGFGRLFGWLAAHGLPPAGAPFIRYHRIDMAGELAIELGVPVTAAPPAAPPPAAAPPAADSPATAAGDDGIHPAHLPAGRYAVAIHTGHYDGLVAANAALQAWARDNGVTFAVTPSEAGDVWAARVEHYLTNPAEEPDTSRWQTELAYLTV
jgi:effector-binding domain-containing protein